MTPVLRRRAAFAALAVQAILLLALVPRDCCAAHPPAAAASCHEAATAPPCPMRGADGTPCPMHAAAAAGERGAECSIRGTCSGPMAAMLSQLSQVTILTEAATLLPDLAAATAPLPVSSPIASRPAPPDPPPPRR